MNILHVFNEYLPKTEVWACELIRHCPDVTHFIIADYYANLDHFEHGVQILNRNKGIIRKKRAQNSRYDFPRNLFQPLLIIGDSLSASVPLSRLIEKNNIDIVHIHFGTTAVDRWSDLKNLTTKIVVSFYGWDYAKAIYYNPTYASIYNDIFQKVDLLLTEGQAGNARLQELGASENKIKSLPLGISIQDLSEKRNFKEDGILQLVQVASLSEKKGQLATIQAFQLALTTCDVPLKLTLVGDERDIYYAKDIKAMIEDQQLSDMITIIDWIDFANLNSFLDGYDVFIHPSQHAANGDCEGGAPVIILHAQSIGLPIISTRHCDIPEQVIHRQTGFLTAEGNIVDLADAIIQFANMHGATYQKMSTSAKEHMATHFDVVRIGNNLLEYYTELGMK